MNRTSVTGGQCCIRVWGGGAPFGGAPCSKPAKVEVGGKLYCATHDPEAAAKRRAKSEARYEEQARDRQAQYAAQRESNRRAEMFDVLIAELEIIATADPRKWDEEVRDQFQQWAQNRARAAIAKATGEAP